jgi:hypothetical protein
MYFLKTAAPLSFFFVVVYVDNVVVVRGVTTSETLTRSKSRGLLCKRVLLLHDNAQPQSAADTSDITRSITC